MMVSQKSVRKRTVSNAERNHAILKAAHKEPIWNPKLGKSQIASLLNWYSYHKKAKDAHKYYLAYIKQENKPVEEIALIKKLPIFAISTSLGWLARIYVRADKENFPKDYVDRLDNEYATILEAAKQNKIEKTEEKPAKPNPNAQKSIQKQTDDMIGTIEGWIDDFLAPPYKSTIKPIDLYKTASLKHHHTDKIAEYYRKGLLAELRLAKSGANDQLAEAYAFLKTREMNRFIKFVELIISDANEWTNITKKSAQSNNCAQVCKPKPPSKQVAKLKYLKAHEELKSIPPTKIIGASTLIVYNIRNRKLGVYECDNAHGFRVKGCTIQNFDDAKSFSKKLRKPEEILPKLLPSKKGAIMNLLGTLKVKEQKLTGRINGDTILLKVL